MLPPFIIEQIRRREEETRQHERPRLELPIPARIPTRKSVPDDEADRGVIIIDVA